MSQVAKPDYSEAKIVLAMVNPSEVCPQTDRPLKLSRWVYLLEENPI